MAKQTKTAVADAEIEDPRTSTQPETANPSQNERTEDQGGIGTLNQVLGATMPEVEVDAIQPLTRPTPQTVVVRVSEDIDNMSYVAGDRNGVPQPPEHYTFKVGHRYEVPIYIAAELDATGKLWH